MAPQSAQLAQASPVAVPFRRASAVPALGPEANTMAVFCSYRYRYIRAQRLDHVSNSCD